jgi:hypothetical protein
VYYYCTNRRDHQNTNNTPIDINIDINSYSYLPLAHNQVPNTIAAIHSF